MVEIDENTDYYAFAFFVSSLEISAKQRSNHSHKKFEEIKTKFKNNMLTAVDLFSRRC